MKSQADFESFEIISENHYNLVQKLKKDLLSRCNKWRSLLNSSSPNTLYLMVGDDECPTDAKFKVTSYSASLFGKYSSGWCFTEDLPIKDMVNIIKYFDISILNYFMYVEELNDKIRKVIW